MKTETALLAGGGLLVLASQVDPHPKRKLAELIAGAALLAAGALRILRAASLGIGDNPLFQEGGGEYFAAWLTGVPGDVARYMQEAPPKRAPGQSDEEANQAALDWLWRNTPSTKARG